MLLAYKSGLAVLLLVSLNLRSFGPHGLLEDCCCVRLFRVLLSYHLTYRLLGGNVPKWRLRSKTDQVMFGTLIIKAFYLVQFLFALGYRMSHKYWKFGFLEAVARATICSPSCYRRSL